MEIKIAFLQILFCFKDDFYGLNTDMHRLLQNRPNKNSDDI